MGDLDTLTRSASAKRYRTGDIPEVQVQAAAALQELGEKHKPVQRASRTADQPLLVRRVQQPQQEPTTRIPRPAPQPQTKARTTQAYQQPRLADTDTDVEIASSVRTRSDRPAPPTRHLPPLRQGSYLQRHSKGITLGVGAAIAAMWLGWTLSTAGASYWATHVTDPEMYGPTHGNVITSVLGGGDNQAHPTKLIAINDNGHVQILKITADDPKKTQIIAGPNLIASDFPDADNVEVELQVDSHQNVIITVYGSTFPTPFHRTASQPFTLVNDGKGNLKPKGGQ